MQTLVGKGISIISRSHNVDRGPDNISEGYYASTTKTLLPKELVIDTPLIPRILWYRTEMKRRKINDVFTWVEARTTFLLGIALFSL